MSGTLRRRLDRLIAADDADGAGLAEALEALRGKPPAPEPPEARLAELEHLAATMRAPPPVMASLIGMLRNRERMDHVRHR